MKNCVSVKKFNMRSQALNESKKQENFSGARQSRKSILENRGLFMQPQEIGLNKLILKHVPGNITEKSISCSTQAKFRHDN